MPFTHTIPPINQNLVHSYLLQVKLLPLQKKNEEALMTPDDCELAETIAKADSKVQAMLRERGITRLDLVACDPWSGRRPKSCSCFIPSTAILTSIILPQKICTALLLLLSMETRVSPLHELLPSERKAFLHCKLSSSLCSEWCLS